MSPQLATPVDGVTQRWTLTAPESYVLRYAAVQPRQDVVLSLAVKELVLRGALRLEWVPVRLHLGRRVPHAPVLHEGPRAAALVNPVLRPVLDVHGSRPGGRRAKALLRACDRAFGGRAYVDGVVLQALWRQGLTGMHEGYTDAGRRAEEELDRRLCRLATFAKLGSARTAAARGAVAEAGMAILLLEHLVPDAHPLRLLSGACASGDATPADGVVLDELAGVDASGLEQLALGFDAGVWALGAGLGGGGSDGGGGGGG